jgi:hypothetical protein
MAKSLADCHLRRRIAFLIRHLLAFFATRQKKLQIAPNPAQDFDLGIE